MAVGRHSIFYVCIELHWAALLLDIFAWVVGLESIVTWIRASDTTEGLHDTLQKLLDTDSTYIVIYLICSFNFYRDIRYVS